MLALAGLATWTIWVTAPAPPPACPLADAVAASLIALIPDVTVHVGAAGEHPGDGDLRLTIENAAAADTPVHVVLADAGAASLLVRDLPARGSCPELAESIALVVERYVSDLGWRPGASALDAGGPPGPAAAATIPAPRRPPPPLFVDLTARAELALGATQPGAAAAAMLGRHRVRVGLQLGATWPRSESVVRDGGDMIGEVDMSSLHVLAGVALHRARRARAFAAAWAGGERVAASAAGTAVFQRVDRSGWQALVRADLGYDLPLTRRLALRGLAAVEVRPAPVEIRVEGASQAHAGPRARLVLGAGVAWRFP